MASIQIRKEFTMPEQELRGRLDELASRLQDELQVDCQWESDRCLHFQRSGAEGQLQIGEREVDLSVRLGLRFAAFKGSIEKTIREFIDRHVY